MKMDEEDKKEILEYFETNDKGRLKELYASIKRKGNLPTLFAYGMMKEWYSIKVCYIAPSFFFTHNTKY